MKATSDQIEVGFFGWVARVARVHQFGQHERVDKKEVIYQYPRRPLLGLNMLEWKLVRHSLLHHLQSS
ncbi:phage virion morphogenesis protein [Janthinobacterium sp. TB1-E2]|uniref:Phage virion morphogenesis protein n=1 Tax=Janthinobacterium aestuarii TaxID=2985511 RepID=A0ABZ2GU32_9BURK